MLPIYHLCLFAFSSKDEAMGGRLWPEHPTLHNFEVVFQQQHHYLNHFWLQMWNSLFIAVTVGLLTLDRRHRARRSRSAASRCAAGAR